MCWNAFDSGRFRCNCNPEMNWDQRPIASKRSIGPWDGINCGPIANVETVGCTRNCGVRLAVGYFGVTEHSGTKLIGAHNIAEVDLNDGKTRRTMAMPVVRSIVLSQ